MSAYWQEPEPAAMSARYVRATRETVTAALLDMLAGDAAAVAQERAHVERRERLRRRIARLEQGGAS